MKSNKYLAILAQGNTLISSSSIVSTILPPVLCYRSQLACQITFQVSLDVTIA